MNIDMPAVHLCEHCCVQSSCTPSQISQVTSCHGVEVKDSQKLMASLSLSTAWNACCS